MAEEDLGFQGRKQGMVNITELVLINSRLWNHRPQVVKDSCAYSEFQVFSVGEFWRTCIAVEDDINQCLSSTQAFNTLCKTPNRTGFPSPRCIKIK